MTDYANASNAMVATVGFYADAVAQLTQERDAAVEVRNVIAKELQATQARENSLRMVLDAAQQFLDTQQPIVPGTPVAKLYDVVSGGNV